MYVTTNLSALLTTQAWQTNTSPLQTLNTEWATGQADASPANVPATTMIVT